MIQAWLTLDSDINIAAVYHTIWARVSSSIRQYEPRESERWFCFSGNQCVVFPPFMRDWLVYIVAITSQSVTLADMPTDDRTTTTGYFKAIAISSINSAPCIEKKTSLTTSMKLDNY